MHFVDILILFMTSKKRVKMVGFHLYMLILNQSSVFVFIEYVVFRKLLIFRNKCIVLIFDYKGVGYISVTLIQINNCLTFVQHNADAAECFV